jgi:hypothetical protein
MLLPLVLALPLFSSACATSKPPVVVKALVPPASRLACKAEPRVPETVTDATTAAFIGDLAAAGQDCRSALQWVREWSASLAK